MTSNPITFSIFIKLGVKVAYSEFSRTSTMEHFTKIDYCRNPLTIFGKISILDVQLGSECASVSFSKETLITISNRTKFMKQCQKIKQNWVGKRNFSIYFLRFYCQAFIICKNGQNLKLLIDLFR